MTSQNQIEFDITIIAENLTLRQLAELRVDLYTAMEKELAGETVKLEQPEDARSLDPAVIGTIAVLLLPVFAEKLGAVLIEWAKLQNECSVTMKVPVEGAEPLEITYNPQYISDEKLKEWITKAIRTADKGL